MVSNLALSVGRFAMDGAASIAMKGFKLGPRKINDRITVNLLDPPDGLLQFWLIS